MGPIIELENVSVIRNRNPILAGITWRVCEGEHWAVIGGNGSGKSFLMNIISANIHPSSGSARVFGGRLGSVSLWELRREIGMVSDQLQTRYSEWTPILEVIYSGFFSSIGIYGNEITNEMRERTLEMLRLLGIEHLRERDFGELSHGEQRKVLIARALVFNPRLLVLDEPCTGLDIPAREEFLQTVGGLLDQGRTTIFVTHHIEEIIPQITHVLFLKDGRMLDQGPKVAMMRRELLNAALNHSFGVRKIDGRYWPDYITENIS